MFSVSTDDDYENHRRQGHDRGQESSGRKAGPPSLDLGLTYTETGDASFVTGGNQLDAIGSGSTSFRVGIERKIGKRKKVGEKVVPLRLQSRKKNLFEHKKKRSFQKGRFFFIQKMTIPA